ncbi:cupin domain-containing protein, partial [Priestia megaterium]
ITVFEGELTISVNSNEYTIKSGNAIRFKADRAHSYYNRGKTLAKLSMIIYYPV